MSDLSKEALQVKNELEQYAVTGLEDVDYECIANYVDSRITQALEPYKAAAKDIMLAFNLDPTDDGWEDLVKGKEALEALLVKDPIHIKVTHDGEHFDELDFQTVAEFNSWLAGCDDTGGHRPDIYIINENDNHVREIIENWSQVFPASDLDEKVVCKFCKKDADAKAAHMHQGEYVGDECCWDERLRSAE